MGLGCVQQSSEGLIIAALLLVPLFFMQTNSHDSSNLSQESSSLAVHSEPVFDFSPANIPV